MKSKQQMSNTEAAKLARAVRSFNQLSKANQKAISRLIEAFYDVEKRAGAVGQSYSRAEPLKRSEQCLIQ